MKSTTDQSFYRISVVSKGGGGRKGGMRGREGWGGVEEGVLCEGQSFYRISVVRRRREGGRGWKEG